MATTVYKLGGVRQDAITGLKTLFAIVTANNFSSFQSVTGTFYIVPAGKTFYVTHIMFHNSSAAKNFSVGHADTQVSNSVAGGANTVSVSAPMINLAANTMYERDVFYIIPAAKYVELYTNVNDGLMEIQGIEI